MCPVVKDEELQRKLPLKLADVNFMQNYRRMWQKRRFHR